MNTPFGADVPLSISSALLRRLEDTARPCVRMAIEGASTSAGAPPHWLEKASDIRTLGFSERHGQSILHVKAPRLGAAVPEVFEQQNLWPGMANSQDTAIQLIGKIGFAVRSHETSSALYDQRLLQHFTHWQGLFKREVRELRLPTSATENPALVALDLKLVENARFLSDQTPAPRQVRVVGKLDMVRHSTRSFGLLLGGGKK